MATYYVNKSGSDANAGTSAALAKLTIQAALNLITGGTHTFIIGAGSYNEKLSIPTSSGAGTVTLQCDGIVQLDGSGLATGNAIQNSSTAAVVNLVIQQATGGGRFIFRNYNGTQLISWNWAAVSNGSNVNISYCEFYRTSQSYAIYTLSRTSFSHAIFNCVFGSGFSNQVYHDDAGSGLGGSQTVQIFNNTFYGATTRAILLELGNAPTAYIYNNVISNVTNAWNVTAATTLNANTNQYYSVTNWVKGASTYTTFASLQAAGYDTTSVVEDPGFVDGTNNILAVTNLCSLGAYIGAYPYSYVRGSNYDPDGDWNITATADAGGWYNPDGNVTQNGTTGDFELTAGTSGVIYSPVRDFTNTRTIPRATLWYDAVFPTNMIDYSTADTVPNYQTLEIRASNTSFTQAAASPSWSEVKANVDFSPYSGRYVQVRLTLRNDDVAA